MNPSLAFAVAVFLSGPSLAHVHVVDAGGSGHFTTIGAAVAAAVDGDVILVRPGHYAESVEIDGFGVVLAPEPAGTLLIDGDMFVRNVPLASHVSITGIHSSGSLTVEPSEGSVVLQSCVFPGASAPVLDGITPFYLYYECGRGQLLNRIEGARSVTLIDCALTGPDGANAGWDGSPGANGLTVTSSSVALYGTTLEGGAGAGAGKIFGGAGIAGAGGDALSIKDANSFVFLDDCTLVRGIGGYTPSVPIPSPHACHGDPIRNAGSPVQTADHPELTLEVPAVLVGGSTPTLSVAAEEETQALLLHGTTLGWRPFGAPIGLLHLAHVQRIIPLGTIPAGGSFELSLAPQEPATAGELIEIDYQVIGFTDSGRFLSEPRVLVIVHSSL